MSELLRITLEAAVPLWIEDLKALPMATVLEIAAHDGQVIAEKGDVLQFGSKRKGEAAEAFNALARGLAALSFSPGGVRFVGQHWESRHPEQRGSR